MQTKTVNSTIRPAKSAKNGVRLRLSLFGRDDDSLRGVERRGRCEPLEDGPDCTQTLTLGDVACVDMLLAGAALEIKPKEIKEIST